MHVSHSAAVVSINNGEYDISIGAGLLRHVADIASRVAPAHRYAIVTDTNVGPLYADRVAAQFERGSTVICTMDAGEANKTRATWETVTDYLLAAGMGRDSTVIALGGGVVCDLAGFVAATFMRGVPVVHVPTSLLAMIDACVGGKTGVDTPAGKNLVGAFHPPRAVIADPGVLDTLPVAELRFGLAEALKHGVVADETYFELVRDIGPLLFSKGPAGRGMPSVARIIEDSVAIKLAIVASDERDEGERKTLNFGHTVGHAIELVSGFTVKHGEAVAIGMAVEAAAGESAGITESGTARRIGEALTGLGLPTCLPSGTTADAVLNAMDGDKKTRQGRIEYAIPTRIGMMAGAECGYAIPLPDAVVREALR